MDVKDLNPELEKLGGNLDELEETLGPLIDSLPEMSSELPLLDKAKLMTMTAYSIESLLFSALRLQGVDTSDHEVMTELKRIKQYFAKVQKLEEPPSQRSTTVNAEAATRMLKSDLGDDKVVKQKLEEKLAEERAKALLNSMQASKGSEQDAAADGAQGKKKRKGEGASDPSSKKTKKNKRKG